FEAGRNGADFLYALGRLDECYVRAVLDEGLRALDRRIEAQGRARIGTGENEEVFILPGIDGGPDAAAGLGKVHHVLSGKVAAAFRAHLILDLHRTRARAL